MINLRKRIGLELWRQLQNNLIKEHPLRQLFWETTLRCNLHCRHCGSDCKTVSNIPDMPREDFMHVLENIAQSTDPHGVFVILTGGEPLLRPDIIECGHEIYSRGFPWGMVTNGLLLTPEKLKALIGAGIHALTISLDGLEENHNWMRGHADSFSRVSRALDLMRAEPTLVYDVVTCVNARNITELSAIRDFLISKGVGSWRLFTVFPVGRAASDPAMLLSSDQFRQVGIDLLAALLRLLGLLRQAQGVHLQLVRLRLCLAGLAAGTLQALGGILVLGLGTRQGAACRVTKQLLGAQCFVKLLDLLRARQQTGLLGVLRVKIHAVRAHAVAIGQVQRLARHQLAA